MIISTGYHEKDQKSIDFAHIWWDNLKKWYPHSRVVVLTTGAPFPVEHPDIQVIKGDNLGHIGDILNGSKTHELCGWSASIMALAMIAYNMNDDLIYREQDCLCFGNWIEEMYRDLGYAQFAFGKKHDSAPFMAASQSLFIVRHKFIPEFVLSYLACPRDSEMLPEDKFVKIEETSDSGKVTRLKFGCDRTRPIPFSDPVFYVQQLSEEELMELSFRGVI